MSRREVEQQLQWQREMLVALDHKVDILRLYLDVRDPGSAKSAEAYDGLRKLLIQANKQTQTYLAHLAQIHYALTSGVTTEAVVAKVEELMEDVGLVAAVEADEQTTPAFKVVEGDGSMLEVLTPAYYDRTTATLIKEGTARATVPSPDSLDTEDNEPEEGTV